MNKVFNINDIVRSTNGRIEGKIIDVRVNSNNDTIYAVNACTHIRWFLAKEIKLVKEEN